MASGFRMLGGWVGALMLASVAAPLHAADGTISFSGAVVQPTCGLAGAAASAAAARTTGPSSLHFGCAGDAAHPAAVGQVFARTVTRLAANERDPVLKYFSDYVVAGAPDAVRPVLITQTYE